LLRSEYSLNTASVTPLRLRSKRVIGLPQISGDCERGEVA